MAETLRKHFLLFAAAPLSVIAVASGRVPLARIPAIEDTRLLLTLLALLLSVEVVRDSGLLDVLVRGAVARFTHARSLGLALVAFAGALSMIVTNDIALFVVIPFTVAAARHSNFRVRNAVILEIVAANLLGGLSPIGNPQNLFLFHRSGMSAGQFVATMAPFVAGASALLLLALFAMEPGRTIRPAAALPPVVNRPGAILGALGIGLVALEVAGVVEPAIPAAYAAACSVFVLRRRVLRADLSIVALFFFVFIDIAALHSGAFGRIFADLPGAPDLKLYLSGMLFSQVISNVPAAVLLAPLAVGSVRTLLYAVNAGGCGTIVASLANLLGWQIYRREAGPDRVFFRRLTAVNFAFLAGMGLLGFLLR